MDILKNLQPQIVFKHFEALTRIPHGSGNEKEISDYILAFATEHGYEAVQDKSNNLVIRMPASKGYENAPITIIQGHMDMVCEKNSDTVFDFEKNALNLYVDGDFIKAKGTTLGADNGIAVAYAMALMELRDFPHPELEIVITTDEEVGMGGAEALDASQLKGRIFLNLDSEEEGEFLSSCAGGIKVDFQMTAEKSEIPAGLSPYRIDVRGLKGGHSGMDIIKERACSNRLIGRILQRLSEKYDICLAEINGGSKDNAIPREAHAVICIKESDSPAVQIDIESFEKELLSEYEVSDPGLTLTFEKAEGSYTVFEDKMLSNVIAALLLTPNGITAMSLDIPGLVESSNNIGVIITDENSVIIHNAVRSSVDSRKKYIVGQITTLADMLGANLSFHGDYPGWTYDRNSKIRPIALDCYKALFGKDAKVSAIHAGLECGVFADKLKGLDSISFGPNMHDVHTPDERLSISSTARVWELLLKLLEAIK